MEPQEKIIAFDNRFFEFNQQQVDLGECVTPNPFFVLNSEENLIVLKLSAQQYLEIVSSLLVGAEWTYPDKSHQILWNFVKAVHCPPILSEQDCVEYPTYSHFMAYYPTNPFVEPNTIPDGYAAPPFVVNGENGVEIPDYLAGDVLVQPDSLTFDIDWFDSLAGQLPTVQIVVQGEGTAYIKLLSVANGGIACITIDNPPDLLDILGGVLSGSESLIDTNRDAISLPPETVKEIIYEAQVTGTGLHTIYIVFLPIVDDSFIPLRYGGGFRGVQLCDFVEQGGMGIESIIWDGCALKSVTNGVETEIVTAEEIQACMDLSGVGGGGGGTAISGRTYNLTISAQNFTNTSFAKITATQHAYTFTKSKALIGIGGTLTNSGNNNTYIKPIISQLGGDVQGVNGTYARGNGSSGRECWAWDYFEGYDLEASSIYFDAKVSGGTGTLAAGQDIFIVIIEFDELSDIFVEDIRISGGELQKKIGGVWIDVTDSFEAIITSLQSQITNAQNTANSALTIANGAVTVNNAQTTRLNALEEFQEDAELELAQNALDHSVFDSRLDALEASSGDSSPYLDFGVWSHQFTWNDANIHGISPFTLDLGSLVSLGIAATTESFPQVVINFSPIENNQITHISAQLIRLGHTNPMEIQIEISGADESRGRLNQVSGASGIHDVWCRFPNIGAAQGFSVQLQSANSDRFYLNGLKFIGRGTNPFA